LIIIATFYGEDKNTPENLKKYFLALSLFSWIIFFRYPNFGDSANLGYLKGFPPNILVGYTSGSGWAGFYGSGINLLLTIYNFQDY